MQFRLVPSLVFSVSLLVALVNVGCGSKTQRQRILPVTPAVDAQKLAVKAFDQVKSKTPLAEDRRTNAYIICVAEALIHDMPGDWEIAIFRKTSPFSYVLPGRKIGVNSGILRIARDQHQLAALLAHGLAHVVARHLENRVAKTVATHPAIDPMRAVERPLSTDGQIVLEALGMESEGATAMPFDTAHEAEGNTLGLELMARAGFNPRQSISGWRSLDGNAAARSSGLAAVHPSYGRRTADLEASMGRAAALQQQALTTRKKPECDRLRP